MISNHKINHHIDLECLGPEGGRVKNAPSVQLQFQLSNCTSSKSPDDHESIPQPDKKVQQPSKQYLMNSNSKRKRKQDTIPLAERSRPTDFQDLKGQPFLSSNSFLPNLLSAQKIHNMLFIGPPGSGKTPPSRMIGS
jgi:DNA replication protein DnaC